MELIKELGLEVYPQFNTGKKVLHVGGPASKVRTYRTSIPAMSPLVLLDLTQFLWKVRCQTQICILSFGLCSVNAVFPNAGDVIKIS